MIQNQHINFASNSHYVALRNVYDSRLTHFYINSLLVKTIDRICEIAGHLYSIKAQSGIHLNICLKLK